jgi:hypothetical protein
MKMVTISEMTKHEIYGRFASELEKDLLTETDPDERANKFTFYLHIDANVRKALVEASEIHYMLKEIDPEAASIAAIYIIDKCHKAVSDHPLLVGEKNMYRRNVK